MKKEYTPPKIEFIKLDFEDIITTSGGCIPPDPNPGNGHGHGNAWGYNNGNHNGHGNGHNPHDNP